VQESIGKFSRRERYLLEVRDLKRISSRVSSVKAVDGVRSGLKKKTLDLSGKVDPEGVCQRFSADSPPGSCQWSDSLPKQDLGATDLR
jgi:hypothetical protein